MFTFYLIHLHARHYFHMKTLIHLFTVHVIHYYTYVTYLLFIQPLFNQVSLIKITYVFFKGDLTQWQQHNDSEILFLKKTLAPYNHCVSQNHHIVDLLAFLNKQMQYNENVNCKVIKNLIFVLHFV